MRTATPCVATRHTHRTVQQPPAVLQLPLGVQLPQPEMHEGAGVPASASWFCGSLVEDVVVHVNVYSCAS